MADFGTICWKVKVFTLAIFLGLFCGALQASVTYTYSPDGRIKSADYGGSSRITYSYDDAGDLISSKGPSPLELWRYSSFGTLDSIGLASDSAISDGLSNLLRFSIGAATGDGLSSRTTAVDDPGTTTLSISWWARNDMPTLSVQLEIEASPGVWATHSGSVTTVTTSGAYTQYEAEVLYSTSAPAWRLTPTLLP